MKEWLAAADLVGLPGMPGTVQGINARAKREDWAFQSKQGRGGGREYAVSSLPKETRDALCEKTLELLPVKAEKNKSLAVYDPAPVQPLADLKQWQREIFDARVIIFREFERLQELHGTKSAITKLLALVETNSLPDELQYAAELANARRGSGRTISRAMILRWQKTVKENGLPALAPKPGAQSNTVPEWANYFIKSYNRPQKPSVTDAMNLMTEIMPETMAMPSYDQVKRFNKSRSTIDRERGRHSPNALRKFKGYMDRITDDLQPGELFLCDGHSFKAKVAHFDHGRPFHPEVCCVICAKTRLAAGWSAGVAESGQTVADALRHAITVNDGKPYGGIPAIFYTDGGSGNLSKLNTHRITGFYARLGITHKTGIPGNAQGRGMVEILNKSLWIRAAKKLPTFTGKEMDSGVQRKVYQILDKSVKKGVKADILPSWNQFMACCAAEIDVYNRTPHSSLPKWTDPNTGRKRYMAPLEYWALHVVEGWMPTVLPEEMVNDLFYPQMIKATRRGAVTLFKNRYSNRNVLEQYHGQQVIVEYDIHNAETVRVRDMQQRLLCTASFQSSQARFFPKEVSQIAIENRMKGQKKLIANKLEDINAQLGQAIEIEMAPTPLTEDEERRAAELLDAYQEPVEEPIEFDMSLLEPLRPHMPEKEFDESLLDDRFTPPSATESYEYDDAEEEDSEPEKVRILPDAVIDARRKFSPVPDGDAWLNLDGFERFEYLERYESLTESQQKWVAYYKTTAEYDFLQKLYRDIEVQEKK
jgi:putative transposase